MGTVTCLRLPAAPIASATFRGQREHSHTPAKPGPHCVAVAKPDLFDDAIGAQTRNEAAAARRGGALGPVSSSDGGGLRIGVGSIR
jgi:hypothetical protein